MKTIIQAYNSADQIINNSIVNGICNVLETTEYNLQKYMIKDFRAEIPVKLKEIGWSDNFYLHPDSKINITSIKEKIGLCIQTGNVSRIYADLLKLQTLFENNIIIGGIIVLPTRLAGKSFGDNIASLERLERELPIFDTVITIPLVLIGFYD